MASNMFVQKRNGQQQPVSIVKLTARLRKLTWSLSPAVDIDCVIEKVISGIYSGIHTQQLDELCAETAASMITSHPDYDCLAARIEVSHLHKRTPKLFSEVIAQLHAQSPPMIDAHIHAIVMRYKHKLDAVIEHDRDYSYDYFGMKTLAKSYLFRCHDHIIERPQHMLMRVAVGIHGAAVDSAIETYHLMSHKYFTHASPTLFNAGTCKPQMSSCFLLKTKHDSIEGIYDTLKQCAVISKHSGGIGLSVHNIRAKNARVRGSNGRANGLVPMLRVFNDTARYVDQGGGRRKGSFAVYVEPWHADIFDFLSLKKNHGKEEERCRDLFFALWIPDLFMRRVKHDGVWSLMCPDASPGLHDVYGAEFDALYARYEAEHSYVRQVRARELWSVICSSQMESGQPFMVYKDHCNRKSNQRNVGTIQSSNLCTEIVQYCDDSEIAVCNLASIALPKFVDLHTQTLDFQQLRQVTAVITRNLNKIIDLNFYPLPQCKKSNLRHRPIGIGVQGLADVFLLLRMPFDSVDAKRLNRDIFECIYYAAVRTSNALARQFGAYASFQGSPASQGLLQFDLWQQNADMESPYDWKTLKVLVQKHGLRNSLLTAAMPTASTSQILGNNECFEPYTSNVYIRRTLAGEFVVINKHLLRDLIELGVWNTAMKDALIAHNGSVQHIDAIPSELKLLYRTVWEIKQKEIIDMAADRAPFIDQSQSMNIHMDRVSYGKLTSMHFYGWHKGLKTGMYYLRTRPAADAIKFTICPKQMDRIQKRKTEKSETEEVKVDDTQMRLTGTDSHDDSKQEHESDEYKLTVTDARTRLAELEMQTKRILLCSRFNKEECISCGS